jgi:hypothetical protein
MIHSALDFLTQELNTYLELKNGMAGDKVVLTNVATETGGWAIPKKSLGLSLINIEEERVHKEQRFTFKDDNGDFQRYNPEVKLNLYILITANFTGSDSSPADDDYIEGLKQLSHVVSFFQSKYVFTNDNSPLMASLDPTLQKLVVELYSYSFEQLYNFWTVVGAKYLPSMLYRVRLLSFQEKQVEQQIGAITEVDIESSNI